MKASKANGISDADYKLIESFDQRLQIIRQRTEDVIAGRNTGLYVHGEGGVSKSFTVLKILDDAKVPYEFLNSRVTAKGLVNKLEANWRSVFLLEDCETLCLDKNCAGVLRSAFHAQEGKQRMISWTNNDEEISFPFRGGIIFTMNMAMSDIPEFRAVATRIPVINLAAPNAEIAAMCRKIASDGYKCEWGELTPKESTDACNLYLRKCEEKNIAPNFRVLTNSLKDAVSVKMGLTGKLPLETFIDSWIEQAAKPLPELLTPSGKPRLARDLKIKLFKQIQEMDMPKMAKLAKFKELTGLSSDVYYKIEKGTY